MRINSLLSRIVTLGSICILIPLLISCGRENSVSPSTGNIFCSGGQSVYLCTTDVSGSRQTILFQDSIANDIASVSTFDDFNNPYCVTVRSDGTGHFIGGSCETAPGVNAGIAMSSELVRACDGVRALITWADSQPSYDPFETGVQVRQVAGLFSAAGKTSTAEMMNAEATIYMSFGGLGAMPGMPAKVLARECNG
jgi:hypothetical protein